MKLMTLHAFLSGRVAGYTRVTTAAHFLTPMAQEAVFRRNVGRVTGQTAVCPRVGVVDAVSLHRVGAQYVLVHSRVTIQTEGFRVGYKRKPRRNSVPPVADSALFLLYRRMHDTARGELPSLIAMTTQARTARPRRGLTRPPKYLSLTFCGQDCFHQDQTRDEEQYPRGSIEAAHRFALSARSICSTVALTAR